MIDMKAFCSDGERPMKWSFVEPFIQGGWMYATDGAICISVAAKGQGDTLDGNFPNMKLAFSKAPKAGKPVPWPRDDKVYGNVVVVGEHTIAMRYHKLISRLPNAKYFPHNSFVKPLRFVFDGGEGMVMGLGPNDKWEDRP